VHVPCVAPGGITQVFGEQQSPFTVHEPPAGRQVFPPGVAQSPLSQNAEQHCAFDVHVAPSLTHAPQTTPSKQYPVQHSSPEVQLWPGSLQLPGGGAARHRREPPPFTGWQVRPLQQSASTEQVSPCGLQAPLVSAQRRTPFWSGTQGAPLQH
jgi:hypothetical protein